MASNILFNIIRFVFLLLLQGMIVNRLDIFSGQLLPQVYLFAILMLPIETPRLLTLIIALSTGLIADLFTCTPGVSASACLVLGYLQPLHQKVIAPRDGYDFGRRPTIKSLGLLWYISYALPLVLAHHFVLFYMEVFRFENFWLTFLKVLLSAGGTLLLLVIGQYFIFSSKPKDR